MLLVADCVCAVSRRIYVQVADCVCTVYRNTYRLADFEHTVYTYRLLFVYLHLCSCVFPCVPEREREKVCMCVTCTGFIYTDCTVPHL